ncbi:MBL fold metallo-hydrolase [Paenibacillus turpanensis]|uniref:MBL fold metallo-hydrolase n=1 Tax=Paenibacillus turpanensis TaxID=2689078 RepID=UPI00140A9D5B|nr:MBL fold metallo-hydrolase [Paenibacillus turpanensis]
MGIRFTILASGSTGNATVVQSTDGEHTLLVDAGLSAKKIGELMKERGVDAGSLDGVLVTHEHADHIKGLGAVARKFDLPVYANEKTWAELERHIGEIAEEKRKVLEPGDVVEFGSLKVESYSISHDAADPVGYCFHEEQQKLALATDLGYMSPKVKEKLVDADVMVLESNHDVEMLRMGKYPWNIKRRILSDVGHLSNDAAGEALSELLSGGTKRVYLAHLSRDHNVMDLARLTVNNVLEEHGVYLQDRKTRLMDTYWDRATEWDDIGEL